MSTAPFTDPGLVDRLYADPTRLARRTGSLHAAKISGEDATATIVGLAARFAPPRPVVWDIGCGRGTTTLALAAHLRPRHLLALDQSPELLATVRRRADAAGRALDTERVDFHHLPTHSKMDVAVAAFCLYHSLHPERVVAQIARRLVAGGHAVLATKSADSYTEIDRLVAALDLDRRATNRPSLYRTFHSGNAETITSSALRVLEVVHQKHVFRFHGPGHLATYLSTTPKYRLPDDLATDPAALATALQANMSDESLVATSTVTYVLAARS